jgi:hypothetical protein
MPNNKNSRAIYIDKASTGIGQRKNMIFGHDNPTTYNQK